MVDTEWPDRRFDKHVASPRSEFGDSNSPEKVLSISVFLGR
jgi:hypothetical protein